jgi:HD-GYP domain-containing protein (c-di-GMP phosphodiesterase class II)
MLPDNPAGDLSLNLAVDVRGGARLFDPLGALDTFIQDLQHCGQGSRQLRLLLKTIADSLHADVVFLQSTAGEGVYEAAGNYPVTPEWCRRLLRDLLGKAQGMDRLLVRAPLGQPPVACLPAPQSAALAQISKSRKTWVAAVSFAPDRRFEPVDLQLMVLTRRLLVAHSRQARAAEGHKEALLGLIHCLTAAIDAKDPYTCGHSERVARMAVRIARDMGLSERHRSDLYLAGLLHDVGKIGIQDSVLQKPGPLIAEEMRHVQEHPVIGDRIISKVSQLAHVRPGVRHHHERMDGQGYPDRLAGPNIPLQARILAVADSCDAMLSPRPYRQAMPAARMEAIMTQGAGSQWDAEIVGHFMGCRQELYSIRQRGIGDSVSQAVEHALNAGVDASRKSSVPGSLFLGDSQPVPAMGEP